MTVNKVAHHSRWIGSKIGTEDSPIAAGPSPKTLSPQQRRRLHFPFHSPRQFPLLRRRTLILIPPARAV
jgi:hypothetical protein